MSRRRSEPPDSLELLLDTLCNTFGGVLFIAILVVIMLQLSGPSRKKADPEQVPAESIEAQTRELETLRREIRVLEETVQQQGTIRDDSAADNLTALRQRIADARKRWREASEKRDDFLVNASRSHVDAQRIEAELEELQSALAAATRDHDATRKQAEDARKARSHTIHLPMAHSTSKTPVSLFARYGRLYRWHRYGPNQARLGLNTDDFAIVEETSDGLITTPIPTAGIPIVPGTALKTAIQQKLSGLPPASCYIQLVVRADSFRQFHVLRDVLTELGYEYSMMVAGEGQRIIDRGGRQRGVQ